MPLINDLKSKIWLSSLFSQLPMLLVCLVKRFNDQALLFARLAALAARWLSIFDNM